MDPLKPFKELMERRLWPVAVVLLLALVAVPLLLSRDPEPAAAPVVPVAAAGASDVEPVVETTDPAARDAARRVLGKEKDPFRAAATPTPTPKPDDGKRDDAKTETKGDDKPASGDGGGDGGGTPSPAPTAAPEPTPTAAPAPRPAFPLHSLEVRFGTTEDPGHAERVLSRLSGLPKGTTPALLYLGLKRDRKTAVFLVQDGVTVLGDGACKPSGSACETLEMRKGDIQFVTVPGGGQYQVEVLAVHTRRTTSARAARDSRTHTFPGGRRWLAQMGGHDTRLRYDAATGVLKRR